MGDESHSEIRSSKEKEKLLRGNAASFSLDVQVGTSNSHGKSSSSNAHQRRKKTLSQSNYEEDLRNLSLNSSRSSAATRGQMEKGRGEPGSSRYQRSRSGRVEDSDNGNESEGSRFTDKSNLDVAERVNRIYESLSSFNERFRNFDALTSSRLAAAAPEQKAAPTNSSRTSVMSRPSGTGRISGRKSSATVNTERAVAVGKPNTKKVEKKKAREARRDVTRHVPKMFGLDPMAVVGDSSLEDDEENSASQFQSQSEPLSGSTDRLPNKSKKAERRHKTQPPPIRTADYVLADSLSDEDEPNLGPVMPLLSDKKFLHKLQQREGRLTKDISDMKNHLDVINTNVEKALRKAQVDADRRKGQNFKGQPKKPSTSTGIGTRGAVKKPLGNMPNTTEGPSKKLTDFLQATGGLTGGWNQDDHSAFMRTYIKWKDRPVKMLDILTKLLPNKSSQDVMAHVSWYDQYDSLHKANQAYIRQWRINKRHEQEMIYRMGSEGHKASLEASKRRQELLQASRQEERQKSRNRLSHWKKTTQQKIESVSDDERKLYVDDFIQKNAQLNNIMSVRKRLEALTEPRNFDDEEYSDSPAASNRKSFSKIMRDRVVPSRSISTRSSSGVFTDTNDSNANNGQIRKSRVSSMRIGPRGQNDESEFDEQHLPKIHDTFRIGANSKLLMQFRSRDNKLIQARKDAIRNIKSRSKNTMAEEAVKKREEMRKIKGPSSSTVMRETKGWTIRNEIRQTEREEAQNEKFLKSLPSAKRRMHPVPFVNHIPKLATPNWRNI